MQLDRSDLKSVVMRWMADSVIFLTCSFFLVIISTAANSSLKNPTEDSETRTDTETRPPLLPSESKPCSIDPALLPSQSEFFLDMFVDRYPADGGYRVKRFDGYEFFDVDRERALEKKRKMLEDAWTKEFQAQGSPATPLRNIEKPLKSLPYKIAGFRSRRTNGFPRHQAYDIMAPEGSPVHPMGYGIIVAMEGDWWKKINHGEPIRILNRSWWDSLQLEETPVSLKSGNFVIIYHPASSKSSSPGYYSFYAHLAEEPPVALGQIVGPSDVIGHVEHSGYNAMRQGHGGHLHASILMNLGKGYLEPIKFAKYWGIKEQPARWRRSAKAAAHRPKTRGRPKKNPKTA